MYFHKYWHWGNDQNLYVKKRAPEPIPGPWDTAICTGFHFIWSALILDLFSLLQIFLPTSKCLNPTVCAQFCPLSLSVPETAMGVTLNAQQHSDSEYVQAIHRWELGVFWGEYCVLMLAILAESHHCSCSWHAVVYIIPTLQTITQWH